MAAHRTDYGKVVKFGTLIRDSPMIHVTKFHVGTSNPLAPPTGQSWTCVYARNFWPVCPIFKNQVVLDSLDLPEFNAPYDVIFRHDGFSAILDFIKNTWKPTTLTNFVRPTPNLTWSIHRICFANTLLFVFGSITVRSKQRIEIRGEAAKQEVGSYLSNPCTHQSQTWYMDSWPHQDEAQEIWWPLTSRGRCNSETCLLACSCCCA